MDSSSSTARSFSVLPVDVSGDSWNSAADANAELRGKSKKKKRKKKVSDQLTAKFNSKGIAHSEFPGIESGKSEISRLILTSSAELIKSKAETRESAVHVPNLRNQESMVWETMVAEYPGLLDGEGRIPAIVNSPLEEPSVTIFDSNPEFSLTETEEFEISRLTLTSSAELRQRNIKAGNGVNELVEAKAEMREESVDHNPTLTNQGSMDWDKVMTEYPGILGDVTSFRKSPLDYLLAEVNGGSTLRSSISAGIERKRQRVYNTMFHVPLRCERLIDVGFFVCLDTFLSLLTIMPARIIMIVWRFLKTRHFKIPNDRELSDFCCFIILVFGVSALQLTDISLIYHIIRGQGTVKLYVVYNVLEIFDNLLRSFGEDVLQVLFNSIEELTTCLPENIAFDLMRYILDQIIAIIIFTLHSFVLLAEAITLSTCVISHNNALLALLVSNNFAEIKSNVFKRVSSDNVHSLVCHDIIERFHISAFVLFILTQNILESESPWFGGFFSNVMLVYMSEVLIDTIKHSFLAKFNEIKPATYSEFLEDLCKQILNIESEDSRKTLTFIPLAPACVVIRVLTPLYAKLLPFGPLPWRWLCIVTYSILSYFVLFICKIVVGRSLSCLASWYLQNLSNRKPHVD